MSVFERPDNRRADQLRPVEFQLDYTKWAEGSVLCAFGDTKVLCTATIEERVPPWMKDQGQGWVTAEYSMLPRATDRRTTRESVSGRRGGRTHEISRLIGRALRGAIEQRKLGERTVTLDCDVIQADGGTRTAAITGAWVALRLAIDRLLQKGLLRTDPMTRQVAAVSLGLFGEQVWLDLSYPEDQRADTDLNLVMTNDDGIVEIQGTAEGEPFRRQLLDLMLERGSEGIQTLFQLQRDALRQESA